MEGLILAYTRLVSNPYVRALLKSVVQDPQAETINHEASKQSVLDAFGAIPDDNEKVVARTSIIGFLNQVMYVVYPNYLERLSETDPINIWLWENHTRLSKFLAVSMVLESANLKSFGVDEPDWQDIPQALIKIPNVIHFAKARVFEKLKSTFRFEVGTLEIHYEAYLRLYTNKRCRLVVDMQ